MERRNFSGFGLLLGFLMASASVQARAKDPYDLPTVVAVEKRAYSVKSELAPHFGILPLDSFNKSLVLGFGYTYFFFREGIGWEIVHANYTHNMDTGLKRDLLDNFGVEPDGILDYPTYYVTTNIKYTPLYTKSLLLNKTLVHGDISVLAGGGAIRFKGGDTAPMFGGGLVIRFFLSPGTSLLFDVRDYVHLAQNKSSNNILSLIIAFSFHLGSFNDAVKE